MLENLFEEEGLAGLSGSDDENSSRVAESDHDTEGISHSDLISIDEVLE